MINFRVLAFEVLRQGVIITRFKQLGSHFASYRDPPALADWSIVAKVSTAA
jgi:hypothetical protein